MKNITASLIFLFLFGFVNERVHAQTKTVSDSIYMITTRDGTSIYGTLSERTDKSIVINNKTFGMVTIPLDSIKDLKRLPSTAVKNGKLWFPNPNASRYFLSPSAIPLKKGEGYFQNTELFLCMVTYGITNNISVAGGMDVLTPFISGSGGPIALLNVKAGFKVADKLYLGAGTLFLRFPSFTEDAAGSFTFLGYGMLTYGTPDINCTFGSGYSLTDGNGAPGPTFTISGMARVSPRFSFISENWIIPTTNESTDQFGNTSSNTKYRAEISYGMRFMSQKIAVDFGFINDKDIADAIAIGIPYVDFVVKF